MYWPDKLVSEIKEKYKDVIASGKPLIIRDEKQHQGVFMLGR